MAGSDIKTDVSSVSKEPHHDQQELCTTRAPYRQGRKLTAVKVYTINDESVHLLINCVPDIKLEKEVGNMCRKFGRVESVAPLPDYPHNQFEVTYLVKYNNIKSSRRAKKIMDGKNFFGGILHVCYAPELEDVEETRRKLMERRREYSYLKLKQPKRENNQVKNNFSKGLSTLNDFQLPSFSILRASSINKDKNAALDAQQFSFENFSSIENDLFKNKTNVNKKRKTKSSDHRDIDLKQINKKRLISTKIKSTKEMKTSNKPQPSMEELIKPISIKKVI